MPKVTNLFLLVILVSAAVFASYQVGIFSKPDFGVEDRGDWKTANSSDIQIESTIWFNNQNPVSLSLEEPELKYILKMNDIRLAEGTKKGLNIEEGNQTIDFRTDLKEQNIQKWWVSHMKNNEKSSLEVPTTLDIGIGPFSTTLNGIKYKDTVETDIEDALDQSISQTEGVYRGPQLIPGGSLVASQSRPEVEVIEAQASFGKIDTENTNILFDIDIKNPNIYPIPAPKLKGNLEMNNVRIAEWNAETDRNSGSREELFIDPGETEEFTFTSEIDNSKIEDWLVSHVRNQEYSEGTLEIKLEFDLNGLNLTVPRGEGVKCDFSLQTAILEDNQKSSSQFEGCKNPL